MKRLSFVVVLLVILGVLVWTFLAGGGIGLVRLYKNYLSQELPDKKYGWQDFTDRGPREMLHGYYAGSLGNSVFIWTYSGLKRFVHQGGTSAYHYLDTCKLIRRLEAGEIKNISPVPGEGENTITETTNFALEEWTKLAHRGDYVWVKRVGEDGLDRIVIDKLWGNSNQYFPLTQIKVEQCKN